MIKWKIEQIRATIYTGRIARFQRICDSMTPTLVNGVGYVCGVIAKFRRASIPRREAGEWA